MQQMRESRKVLLLGSDNPRMARLSEILSRHAKVARAEDIPEGLGLLARGAYEAVFCDGRFHCGTWQEALETIQALYPELPIVIVSQTNGTDEGIREWTEVLYAGAFDLLLAPSNEYSVVTVMEHALASGEARALRAAG